MKTAMQDFIDKLPDYLKFEYMNDLINVLEKEKEQSINDYREGQSNAFKQVSVSGERITPEDYYNKTYNVKPFFITSVHTWGKENIMQESTNK